MGNEVHHTAPGKVEKEFLPIIPGGRENGHQTMLLKEQVTTHGGKGNEHHLTTHGGKGKEDHHIIPGGKAKEHLFRIIFWPNLDSNPR